jgi:epoxyqueuosine reductase
VSLSRDLKQHARERGIDVIGITSAEPIHCLSWNTTEYNPSEQARTTAWVHDPCSQSRVADNVYDPTRVLANAHSIVMAAMYMYGVDKIIASTPGVPRGKIGPWTRDYSKGSSYAGEIVAEFLKAHGFQGVSTNSLPYKTLALRTGAVSIGKNGFVFTKEHGSFLRWTCVVTDAELERRDIPIDENCAAEDCGQWTICIDTCPTGALQGIRQYERNLCLHLWLRGAGKYGPHIPPEERAKTGTFLVRCGHCLEVCPKNCRLTPRESLPYQRENKPDSPELIPLVLADDEAYKRMLPASVVKYGIDNVRRNVYIALGNIGDPAAIPVLREASKVMPEELRELATWAIEKIGTTKRSKPLKEQTR